jgi:hypothetical protein
MTYPKQSIVVLDIAGKHARVHCDAANTELRLLGDGFSKEGTLYVRPIRDDEDRKRLVLFLAGLGALFSGGKDWAPAELLAYYKEQGMQIGCYSVITWRSPNEFLIEMKP